MIADYIDITKHGAAPSLDTVMSYEAPYLIEKLLKEHIVDTAEEAERLFAEVKRYLWLTRIDRPKLWEMYSLRIDEVWHQFILFTREYMEFCRSCFGHYVPHSPSNAPMPEEFEQAEVGSFAEFGVRYAEAFGEPLPGVWRDENSVTINRRVVNDHVGMLAVRVGNGVVELLTSEGELLLSVNDLALPALTFVVRNGAFYVRELPGDLENEEKVALIATLVRFNLLRVGS